MTTWGKIGGPAKSDAKTHAGAAQAAAFAAKLEGQKVGRGGDTVGNPHRIQNCKFELFEFIFLSKLDNNPLSNSSRQPCFSQQYPPPSWKVQKGYVLKGAARAKAGALTSAKAAIAKAKAKAKGKPDAKAWALSPARSPKILQAAQRIRCVCRPSPRPTVGVCNVRLQETTTAQLGGIMKATSKPKVMKAALKPKAAEKADGKRLAGKTVCFTGSLSIQRNYAIAMAINKGAKALRQWQGGVARGCLANI